MRNTTLSAVVLLLVGCASPPPPPEVFLDTFVVGAEDWTSSGSNSYFILEPGYVLELAGEEHGKDMHLVVTVTNETKVVDGVETRVVEERESEGDEVVEVSRNYYAFSTKDQGVYYFGEDVDKYEDGKVAKHGGSWHAGENGARFGLTMPGVPSVGMRWYQELAPHVAMDRSEVLTFREPVVLYGETVNCLKTKETSAVEKGTEFKCYAAGIGLVVDGPCKLVRHGMLAGK
jgi:hypothetical protein